MIIDDASEKLIKHLTRDQNILKAVEECAELSEVLLKTITKAENLKPSVEKLVEEMGDVVFRIIVLSKMFGVEDEVQNRVEQKAEVLNKWALSKFKN